MARRRKRPGAGFSLFPFLSVLLGVAGTMMLITSALTWLSFQDANQVVVLTGGTTRTPHYVECRARELILHPEGVRVGRNETDLGPAWQALLRKLCRDRRTDYLVLLVRPDGFDSFAQAVESIEAVESLQAVDLDYGYDAVYAGGEFEFTDGNGGPHVASN